MNPSQTLFITAFIALLGIQIVLLFAWQETESQRAFRKKARDLLKKHQLALRFDLENRLRQQLINETTTLLQTYPKE